MGSCVSNDTKANTATTKANGGDHKSPKSAKEDRAFKVDKNTLADFLHKKENLDHVWSQMDKDNNGYLDQEEFQRLLRVALAYFCELRDPDMPRPDDATMTPFVEKLSAELSPHIDKNGDGRISQAEFLEFGNYLDDEHKKLQNELQPEGAGGGDRPTRRQ